MAGSERSGRRGFLTHVGMAAGAVAIAAPQRALARPVTSLSEDDPRGDHVAPLGLGTAQRIGAWTIVAVHPVRFGAVPVVMARASGERFQLDVLRRDTDPKKPDGVGNTGSLSIYLVNQGDGETATREEHGLGAMALADALATGEVAGPRGLLTFAERHERHPRAAYSVPLD